MVAWPRPEHLEPQFAHLENGLSTSPAGFWNTGACKAGAPRPSVPGSPAWLSSEPLHSAPPSLEFSGLGARVVNNSKVRGRARGSQQGRGAHLGWALSKAAPGFHSDMLRCSQTLSGFREPRSRPEEAGGLGQEPGFRRPPAVPGASSYAPGAFEVHHQVLLMWPQHAGREGYGLR